MTSFALVFMTVSMACVTLLAAFCLYRILRAPIKPAGDSPDEE